MEPRGASLAGAGGPGRSKPRSPPWWWLTCALALGSSSPAGAEPRPAIALVVERAPELTTCPEGSGLREQIAARLGYDPVQAKAESTLLVSFSRDDRALVATIERRLATGEAKGSRQMRSETGDCTELAASVALAVALLLDPEAAGRPPAPPPAPPPPVPPPVAPPPAAPAPAAPTPVAAPAPPPEEPSSPVRLAVSAGPVVGAGHVPGVSLGPRIGVALRKGIASIGASGTALVEGHEENDVGTTRASAFFGSVLPCVRWTASPTWSGDVCAEAQIGALFASAESVDRSVPTTEALVAFGPFGSVEAALGDHFALRFTASIVAAATQVHLVIDDAGKPVETWATPPVAFLAGFEPVVLLP